MGRKLQDAEWVQVWLLERAGCCVRGVGWDV